MRNFKSIIIAVASVAVVGFAINAYARGGMGWDDGWGHHGRGWYHHDDYGQRYDGQMSQEQYEQLQQKQAAFYKDTQDLRSNLYDKELALQNELAKDAPDTAKASGLQKEISDLRAQLDQKRIDYMIEVKKLAPNVERDFTRGGPMMGYGPMMDYGPRGGGYCW